MSNDTRSPASSTAPATPSASAANPASREQANPDKPAVETAPDRWGDWCAGTFVFGIIGGCFALFAADLSLPVGGIAAVLSGTIGLLFSDG